MYFTKPKRGEEMKPIGIEQIIIKIPSHFIRVEELEKARELEPSFATKGLGCLEARIPYLVSLEDLIVEAVKEIKGYEEIERFYVGTESDYDASKAEIAMRALGKLGLHVVPFQLKFACLAGLLALIAACEYVEATGKSAIVIIFDRSIYSSREPKAEVTQGCAAVAIKVSNDPMLAVDFLHIGQYGDDIDDFKVPLKTAPYPVVKGPESIPAYLMCQKKTLESWKVVNTQFPSIIDSLDYCLVHIPFPKIVEWVMALFWHHEKIRPTQLEIEAPTIEECIENPQLFKEYKKKIDRVRELKEFKDFFDKKVKPGLKYSPYIGNSYTCSIFVALISVLEQMKIGEETGISGYGSGAASLMVRVKLMKDGFKSNLKEQIEQGKEITIEQYEEWRRKTLNEIRGDLSATLDD